MRVTELNIYPLKSARGIPLSESAVSAEGLPGDRRAMLTDPSGYFITQRELPAIATVLARHEDGGMVLARDKDGEIFARPSGQRMDVAVWKSIVSANIADDETNGTLSAWLGREVKLAFLMIPRNVLRASNGRATKRPSPLRTATRSLSLPPLRLPR